MILLVNICKEKLHYYEFVKPIEKVLKEAGEKYEVIHYKDLKGKDLEKFDKVIICGTSLFDNGFVKDIDKFSWIKEYEKPILGICGGMQIIGLLYGGELKEKTEIGYYFEEFVDPFLGLEGEVEVYHLHNNYVDVSNTKEFKVFADGASVASTSTNACAPQENLEREGMSQAIMHREKEIYGVLFHPEVRNKKLIEEFVKE